MTIESVPTPLHIEVDEPVGTPDEVTTGTNATRRTWPGVLALTALLLLLSIVARDGTLRDLVPIVIYAIAGHGLNVLMGTAGVVSLGAPAFFGVGAFTVAHLGIRYGWPFLPSVLAGVALSAIVSLPIAPIAGRLKGVYLAMATMGLIFLGLHVFRTAETLTGGVAGTSVPAPSIGGLALDSVAGFYRMSAVVLVIVTLLTTNLLRSRTGRALQMLETSPVAARSLGISPLRFRAVAFVYSSGLAGLAGALLASWQEYIAWDQFQFAILGSLVAIIVIGGRGSVYGTIAGAAVVLGLPEVIERATAVLPFISETSSSPGMTPRAFANLVTGALIVVVVVLEPGGLARLARRIAAAARPRQQTTGAAS